MSGLTDRQLLDMTNPYGNRIPVWQRWLVRGLIVLVICVGLLFAYHLWQDSQPTAEEIARTEVVVAYLASNPMLEGYRKVVTDVRVEFHSDPSGSGYYLYLGTTLTEDDIAFADGMYTHFTQLQYEHPELAPFSMVFVLDDSGRLLLGGAA